jgi:phosphoribosyl-dephospho-CoA transferase
MTYPRHRMLRVAPEAWAAMLAETPQDLPPVVREWAERGLPLVARRQACGDVAGSVFLGLPLPPSLGKLRLSFAVPRQAVVSDQPPPLLSQAAEVAPEAWRATIAALVQADAGTRCYGSLAWHWLTGLAYLSSTSDLDLLWQVPDRHAADAKAASLAAIARQAPMSIDGELVTPRGEAVQWSEWLSDAPEVLVKSSQGGQLMARDAVFA